MHAWMQWAFTDSIGVKWQLLDRRHWFEVKCVFTMVHKSCIRFTAKDRKKAGTCNHLDACILERQPSFRADACVKKKLLRAKSWTIEYFEQWVADLASSPRTPLYSQVSERLWGLRERWNSGYNRYSSARFSRHLSEMCRITQINVSYITEMSKKRKSGENPLKTNI